MSVDQVPETRERLSFLLARRGQMINARMRKALGSSGFTPRHLHVLAQLSEHGPMGQQALIEVLGVDPSVLVSILNDLERDGLAERRRDTGDRRRHIVEMSRRGAAVLRRSEEASVEVEDELFADLDQAERAQLRDLLARVGIACDKAGAYTDDPCLAD